MTDCYTYSLVISKEQLAKLPKVAPNMAELAYCVSPVTMKSGRTDKTALPTITAEVVPIRFVIIDPQIAIVETTSA